jgi:hypothetical protein
MTPARRGRLDGCVGHHHCHHVRYAFDLLREWVLVFDARSRSLHSDQDRANVLMAIAMSAQRIADGKPEPSAA